MEWRNKPQIVPPKILFRSMNQSMQCLIEEEKRTFCIEVKPGSFMFDLSSIENKSNPPALSQKHCWRHNGPKVSCFHQSNSYLLSHISEILNFLYTNLDHSLTSKSRPSFSFKISPELRLTISIKIQFQIVRLQPINHPSFIVKITRWGCCHPQQYLKLHQPWCLSFPGVLLTFSKIMPKLMKLFKKWS